MRNLQNRMGGGEKELMEMGRGVIKQAGRRRTVGLGGDADEG